MSEITVGLKKFRHMWLSPYLLGLVLIWLTITEKNGNVWCLYKLQLQSVFLLIFFLLTNDIARPASFFLWKQQVFLKNIYTTFSRDL